MSKFGRLDDCLNTCVWSLHLILVFVCCFLFSIIITAVSLHGDKAQAERMEVVRQFKKAEVEILCATDVAGMMMMREFRAMVLLLSSQHVMMCYLTYFGCDHT
jgi:Na+/glutamate symporter